jgi:hypothetical protein
MNFLKKIIENYRAPTPSKWRRIGDSLLGICIFASPYQIIKDCHACALTLLFIGIVGKFITDFYSEKKDDNNS